MLTGNIMSLKYFAKFRKDFSQKETKKLEKTHKNGLKYIWIMSGVLLLAAIGLLAAARKLPGFADWYTATVYPVLVSGVGRVFGIFPFSVVEFGLYGLLLFLIYILFRFRKKPFYTITICAFIISALLFSYSAGCGVNYYRKPFSSYLSLDGEMTGEDLKALCRWLTEKVNLAYADSMSDPESFSDMGKKGVQAMESLSEEYTSLSGFYPRPKPVFISWILSVQQYSGVYSPFTVEANYNRDMISYNIPHTICHELSHLRGFMREDEANFIGYLACLDSESADFRYSGYLLGWIYAGNALAGEDYTLYKELYEALDDGVKKDLNENSVFWDKYEGKAAEAANKVNDTYLKANGQPEGVKTYGRVVDLMILDFLKNRQD
jgi:hypothetical protein